MEIKFLKVLDLSTFTELQEVEQKSILIQSNVYVKGKSVESNARVQFVEMYRTGIKYPNFLGKDFIFNNENFKLNDDLLDEILFVCSNHIKIHHTPIIEEDIETVRLKAEIFGNDILKEFYTKEESKLNDYLSSNLYKKLHYSDFDDEQEHFNILKEYLKLNYFDLSEYLFGLEYYSTFQVVRVYNNFKRLGGILSIVNLKKNSEDSSNISDKKFSRPKFIAMLNELNFFKWKSIAILTNDEKGKIILALLQQDHNDKHSIHNVVKNFQSLNPHSNLNPKYTAYTHIEPVKKILSEINKNL